MRSDSSMSWSRNVIMATEIPHIVCADGAAAAPWRWRPCTDLESGERNAMTGFYKNSRRRRAAQRLRRAPSRATAVAAWRRLQGQPFMTPLPLRSRGRTRDIAVAGVALHARTGRILGGQTAATDIDITDQALIRAQ